MKTKPNPKCSDCGDHHAIITPRCARYNGYTNYETFAAITWLTNTEASQRYWVKQAQRIWNAARSNPQGPFDVGPNFKSVRARGLLEESLREYHETKRPDLDVASSIYSDLLNAALSTVDWLQIADNLLSGTDGIEGYEAKP